MALKINIRDIPPEGVDMSFNFSKSDIQSFRGDTREEEADIIEPLEVRLRVETVGRDVIVRGRVGAKIRSVCARCLEVFEQEADEEIFMTYIPYPEGYGDPEEIEVDDLNLDYYFDEEIDLWPIIEETLVLAQPIKPLCRTDCQGLCPDCGWNRNQGECHCDTRTGHPGLAALGKIRDKLPPS